MQTPSFLWITDPWSTLDHSKDTTLRLMHEAINMGIPTFWSASDQLFSTQDRGCVSAAELKKKSDVQNLFNAEFKSVPLSTFQQIHNRVDPPVDEKYRKLIDQLIALGATEKQILNPPRLLKHQSEKIPPSELRAHTPRMLVVKDKQDIVLLEKTFLNDSEVVSKPLHLAQSVGVEKHPKPSSLAAWEKLLENLTKNFSEEILIEEFLPGIAQGEVRLWFAGEKLIAALKKYPKTGDFRVLIDEGSRVTAHTLSEEEKKIASDIGKVLKKEGILLAAIDLIGHKICDYNITSPGLLVQLEQVHGGKNFARDVLNQALQYRAPTDRE